MEDKGRKGLLERFQEAAGCAFLSDLTAVSRQEGTCILIEMVRMCGGDYTLGEWNDAAAYITGRSCDFQSIEEVSDYLVRYLS